MTGDGTYHLVIRYHPVSPSDLAPWEVTIHSDNQPPKTLWGPTRDGALDNARAWIKMQADAPPAPPDETIYLDANGDIIPQSLKAAG